MGMQPVEGATQYIRNTQMKQQLLFQLHGHAAATQMKRIMRLDAAL